MDEIRIYVSAATGDLGAERTLLADVVLPRLRERAAAAGRDVAWELVDPEARAAAWSLKDRLRAIDGAPLFVAFVGERLGPPLPPPQTDLLRSYPWLADLAGASLGETEIVHGALVDPQARRSFLYLRALDLPVPPRERLRFRAATREEADRLGELKASLRASGRPLLDGYAGRWDAAARRVVGLEALADRLVDDLWAAARGEPVAGAARPASPSPVRAGVIPVPAALPRPSPPAAPAIREDPPSAMTEISEPRPPNVEPDLDDTAVDGTPPPLPQIDEHDMPPPSPRLDDPELPPRRGDDGEPGRLADRAADAAPLPAPNPLVSSLPPLRGPAERPRFASSAPWLAIALLLLALVALVLWFLVRH
jgi:hypothetical protein